MNKLDAIIIQESLLLTALQNKSNEKLIYNDYINIFFTFKRLVSLEIKNIVHVFPEYTPHDEEYHLQRLLFLAESILGHQLINTLNATELLVLCLSIYGHDWGMAMSEAEMRAIADSTNNQAIEFALINSERARFAKHLYQFNEEKSNISQFVWQEYIRNTHAERSAERIRKYFRIIDNGIGEATARICLGHWLDFKDIRDQSMYPLNYIVKNQSINLRALTIYLRLIDLFDITNERTPYTIYKYTAPQSFRSKMEWAKHYSINSLGTVQFQGGRIIQVDGQTEDYKVYAELEDLRNFCKDQLIGCNDLLKDVADERYYLNIFDIKWDIKPLGFDPISIKFQFDRKKIFDILSEEIYKGDRYVFIRELLQNSIDAIKLRKEWIEKSTEASMNNFGKIFIEVDDIDDDIISFSITDDGIGMDLYIIENYLSIAGKSYYNSEEFKKLGLEMDPISKFGVGILSCFMVADKIQIITYKDPLIKKNGKVIKIDIPYVDQQFRISATDHENEKVGTTVKVFISKEKIKNKIGESAEFNVLDYLKNLTGYIEFPIFIKDEKKNTVILDHLKKECNYSDCETHLLDTTIDFNKVFLPQSLKLAKENFVIKEFSIHEDLNIDGLIGSVSFLIPSDPFLKISENYHSNFRPEYSLIFPGKRKQDRNIKIKYDWTFYRQPNINKEYMYGASSYSSETYKVYLDGILVPGAVPPVNIEGASYEGHFLETFFDYFPSERFAVPLVNVQFSKNDIMQIDISRTEIIQNESWDDLLAAKLHLHIIDLYKNNLSDSDLKRRMMFINYLIYFYRVPLSSILDYIELENAPLLTIDDNGALKFDIWKNYIDKTIYFQPFYTYWFREAILKEFDERYEINGFTVNWKGDKFIFKDITYPELREKKGSAQAIFGSVLGQFYATYTHIFSAFRFLESPWLEGPALIQPIWVPLSNDNLKEDRDLIKCAAEDINSFKEKDFNYLLEIIQEELHDYIDVFPKIGHFQAPYEDSFGYGTGILNLKHRFSKGLLRILANIIIYNQTKNIESPEWAQLIDKIMELPFFDYNTYFNHEFSIIETNLVIGEINNMINTARLIENYDNLDYITYESFVKYTIFEGIDENYYQFFNLAETDYFDLNHNYSLTL